MMTATAYLLYAIPLLARAVKANSSKARAELPYLRHPCQGTFHGVDLSKRKQHKQLEHHHVRQPQRTL